jgi:hypothetical protein
MPLVSPGVASGGVAVTVSQMSSRIGFGPGVPWAAFSQLEMGLWAQRSDIQPLATRVLFAAMSRVNRAGHAAFGKGELADMLGRLDDRTGEIVSARADTVSKAITAAKRVGFVMDDSTARCLVLPGWAFQRNSGGAASCTVHG